MQHSLRDDPSASIPLYWLFDGDKLFKVRVQGVLYGYELGIYVETNNEAFSHNYH